MFGSQLRRVVRAALGILVGSAGVLVLSFSLLIAVAPSAASSVGPPMGVAPGMAFAPAARLDASSFDDLRAPVPAALSSISGAACRAAVLAGSARCA